MNSRLHIKLLLIILILCSLISCERGALFNAGEIEKREIPLYGKITAIEVNTMSEITLVQDTINKAIVTCGKNLQPDIEIYLKDNILHFDNTIKYSWSRSYEKIKLELHLISIPQLNTWKPAFISTKDTFKTYEFFLVNWGKFTEIDVTLDANNCAIDVSNEDFGHYSIKGKSISSTFNVKGSSFIYADELQVQNCTVKQTSIGDIYVNVSNLLTVSIESTGKVYYYGNPVIIMKNDFSKSKLIHLPNN